MNEKMYSMAFETAMERGSETHDAHQHAIQTVLGNNESVRNEVETLEAQYAAGMISYSYYAANRMFAILSVEA